jgi:hypothetical protein
LNLFSMFLHALFLPLSDSLQRVFLRQHEIRDEIWQDSGLNGFYPQFGVIACYTVLSLRLFMLCSFWQSCAVIVSIQHVTRFPQEAGGNSGLNMLSSQELQLLPCIQS